jgi:hypothetical protein
MATLTDLCGRLGLQQFPRHDPTWSAAPDFLELIVGHALSARPANVVECSSGLTTLMLAKCCELNGFGKVFSLENGAEFAADTRAEIERHALEKYADVIEAPLTGYELGDREYRWYALDGLSVHTIDMLVIDGPPGFIQRHSRYPALPLLFDRLAEGCTIFLDDAARADERQIVEMWSREFPAVEHEYVEAERGCSILRIRRGAGHPAEAL